MAINYFFSVLFICIVFNFLKKPKIGLILSLIALFFFLGLRYDYGNDYMMYKYVFELIKKGNNYEGDYFVKLMEYGYLKLNILFSFTDFNTFLFFLGGTQLYIIYKLIYKNIKKEYYWFSLFIFLFQYDNLILQLTTIRQSIAILIFIFYTNQIKNKNFIKYLFTIIFMTFFHRSSILLIFIYPIFFKKDIFKKVKAELLLLLPLSMIILKKLIFDGIVYLTKIIPKFQYYIDNYFLLETNTGLGIVYNYIIYLIIIIKLKKIKTEEERQMFLLALMYYLIYFIGALIFPMISRIGLYFAPFLIVVIPKAFEKLNGYKKNIIISSYILFHIITMIKFFNNEIWIEKNKYYKNIIFDKK